MQQEASDAAPLGRLEAAKLMCDLVG